MQGQSRLQLLLRGHRLALDRPLVMGVLNVTPDSFSDGGRYVDPGAAVKHALEMVEEGADLIDIGAESSRPGAEPFAVPFSQGSGNVEKVPFESINPSARMGLSRRDWETMPKPYARGITLHQADYMPHVWRPITPTAADDLSCLRADAQSTSSAVAVVNGLCFK